MIPTAKFGIFKNFEEAKKFIDGCVFPLVVKADGSSRQGCLYL